MRSTVRRILRGDVRTYLTVAFASIYRRPVLRSSLECVRKVRVGANSPSLCPTIWSEMNTGTCLRPSWTAIVCPIISGNTVDDRDQVRIICFDPDVFIASMRCNRRSSTNGPFFELRLTYFLPRFLERTINLSDSLCLRRVGLPSVGTPHGVTGWRPPFDLPSPPPCGWSTGFIAEPRTVGRLPRQRLRPALPPDSFSWSRFPTCPTVARQVSGTLRISPEGSRSTA